MTTITRFETKGADNQALSNINNYRIQLSGLGGEWVIGRLTRPVAEYWSQWDRHALAKYHLQHGGRLELDIDEEVIDEAFTIQRWHECDDIMHEYGIVIECNPDLIVEQNDQQIYQGTVGEGLFKEVVIEPERLVLDDESPYFGGHTADTIHQCFEFELSEKIELAHLKIRTQPWFYLNVISGIEYKGVVLPMVHECSAPDLSMDLVAGITMN